MILLTGASGFIGKHLLRVISEKYGVDNVLALTSGPIENCRYLLHQNYTFEKDYFIKSGFGSSISVLIHAGAFTPKNSSQANDWQECNKNIINMDRLLKAELPNLKKIIYLSTLDVYGVDDVISEESALSPASLYGHSKLYGEHLIRSWGSAEDRTVQILRIGHVYGPGEEAYQKIIPVVMRKIIAGEEIEIFGTGDELRSFIYIGDVVRAIINSIDLTHHAGAVNLVGGLAISIKELVNKIISISGKNSQFKVIATNTPGRNFIFDNRKMKDQLLPLETSLEQGLLEEWSYMKNL